MDEVVIVRASESKKSADAGRKSIVIDDADGTKEVFDASTLSEETGAPAPVVESDGGFGWVIIAASFLIHFVALGLVSTFGVWQAAYKQLPEFANASSLSIAFIGSLGSAGLPLFSIPAGRLTDKYGPRIVGICGAAIVAASLVLASFSTELWQLLVTQGFLFGIGTSIIYLPGLSVISDWFVKRRGMATGIAVAGSGVGGLALGPILRALISQLGWRWTLRLSGIVGGAVLALCALILRIRTPRKSTGKAIDLSLFKDQSFLLLYAMSFINSFAYFVPFFFVPTYALKYGMTSDQGALLIGLLNGASGVGRICLGFSSDFIGPINTLTGCLLVATLSVLLIWPFATTFGTLLLFVLFFGFFIGGFISLLPTVIAQLFGGKGNIATVTGMVYNSSLLGNLFGSPIAGAMLDHFTTVTPTGRVTDFMPAILFSGCCMICGWFFMAGLKFLAGGKRFLVKV
ncbi:hypothetical protein HK105_202108 [Polyrhizophydium stewartii]|uniref:Major facilitator superfamily (MFS) profile domain-containing protein n=1 Tax=Polyrhizophydium stewartii TaxID=2732419 RepID=A0ABR4NFF6_9FUNG|nr:hypothetical protein HK105_008378 [Polyrhizophydium stewartii]